MHGPVWKIVVGSIAMIGCATARPRSSRDALTGVRFAIGPADLPTPAQGAFGVMRGTVEFAAGRGRLDVVSRDARPPIAYRGVTLLPPLAGAGDYYLFDSTGVVLVRPTTRTFSTFAFSESSYRLGDAIQARERMMEIAPFRPDTVPLGDSTRIEQHGPFTLRWHLDRRRAQGPAQVLARGWIEIVDAPAGEASAARWFGAAAALAAMHSSLDTLPRDSLQVTALAVVPTPGADVHGVAGSYVALVVQHLLSDVTTARIDPARLVLPADYTEAPWPGFATAARTPVESNISVDKWRIVPQ